MPARIVDGKQLAQQLRQQIAERVTRWTGETSIQPHLAAVLVGDDPASAVYVRNKRRACEQVGIRSSLHALDAATTTDDLLRLVDRLNADATVHGILIQLPLPAQIDRQRVLDAVHPLKDVDAFHPENVGLLAQGRPRYLPCTPHGILRLLQFAGVKTSGMHAVILGRSEIVGKPTALLLARKGEPGDATVTICHSRTRDLAAITRQADLLIAAIGRPRFVTAEMVKPGAVVIDVGINRVDGRLVGDVDFEAVLAVASAITPVPGGVGPLTVTMLLHNTLQAAWHLAGASGSAPP